MALPRGRTVWLAVCAGLAALLAPACAKLYNRVPANMDRRGSGNPKDWDPRRVTSLYGVFYRTDFNADISQSGARSGDAANGKTGFVAAAAVLPTLPLNERRAFRCP